MIENAIIVAVVAAIVAAIGWYLRRRKRRGDTCIGCPYARQCGGTCHNENGHP